MGSAERREREREQLRTQMLEAARDILSEHGFDGLSMRAIADRIEYSPATIYLHFKDKEELIRNVVMEAFTALGEAMRAALAELGSGATHAERYRATGRAYVRFALENTAYFRIMFELPGVPQMDCPEPHEGDVAITEEKSFDSVVGILRRAVEEGEFVMADPEQGALVGWGLVHGLTSLFLSGRLSQAVASSEEFLGIVEAAMDTLAVGWIPRDESAAGEDVRLETHFSA